MSQSGTEDRLSFLENLRAVVVFLIIVLHGSMIFMKYAPDWWYVVDSGTSLFFTFLVLVLDIPLILILLFIAGYYVYPALVEFRANGFLRRVAKHIGVPWVIGVFLLAPPIGYLTLYSRNMPVPYALYLEEHFWKDYFTQSVYWFLGVLIVLYAAVTLVYYASVSFRSIRLIRERPDWISIAVFLGILSAAGIFINLSVPLDAWRHYGYLIMVQPVRVPLYIGYFLLGIYAYKNGWFRSGGYLPESKLWIPLAIFSGIVYVLSRIMLAREAGPEPAFDAVAVITMNMFAYSAIMGAIGLSHTYLNYRTTFWIIAARNWYGMYYIHPLILFPAALYVIPLEMNVHMKAAVVILAGWGITWLISTYILTKAPLLRDTF